MVGDGFYSVFGRVGSRDDGGGFRLGRIGIFEAQDIVQALAVAVSGAACSGENGPVRIHDGMNLACVGVKVSAQEHGLGVTGKIAHKPVVEQLHLLPQISLQYL